MEFYLEQHPANPYMRPFVTATQKMIGDNPDALYYFAPLNLSMSPSQQGYILTGTLTQEETYMSVTLYGASTQTGFAETVVSEINSIDLMGRRRQDEDEDQDDRQRTKDHQQQQEEEETRQQRRYTVYLTPEKPSSSFFSDGEGSAWLRMNTNVTCVITRHYFERAGTPAQNDPTLNLDLHIRPYYDSGLSSSSSASSSSSSASSSSSSPSSSSRLAAVALPPPDDADMARRLRLVADFVRSHTFGRPPRDPTKAPPWFSFEPNVIGKPTMWSNPESNVTGGMGAPDIAYGAGYFKLNPGEGLEITGRMPEKCVFANVVLW
eukprot:CAMPEP_0167773080 /NCGR_PEP_ID=MMETSP0111_2-20121227/1216_1 /TAXON_ID=91324 /ORGANISM="Lotharella globosa, Strain CCCM811" /LENGTH=320 /DNA_ID=CAMNT_0007662667 /DNA_START=184 /DNA_END=1143 /DNA_ORIENTATION=-